MPSPRTSAEEAARDGPTTEAGPPHELARNTAADRGSLAGTPEKGQEVVGTGQGPRPRPPEEALPPYPAVPPTPRLAKGVYKDLCRAPEKLPLSLRDLTTAWPNIGDLLCLSLHVLTSAFLCDTAPREGCPLLLPCVTFISRRFMKLRTADACPARAGGARCPVLGGRAVPADLPAAPLQAAPHALALSGRLWLRDRPLAGAGVPGSQMSLRVPTCGSGI